MTEQGGALILSIDRRMPVTEAKASAAEKVLSLIQQIEKSGFFGSLTVKMNFGEGRLSSAKIISTEQEIRI